MSYLWYRFFALALIAHCALAVTPTGKVDFTEADDLNDETNSGFVSVYKNYPKIQVTVDTQKLKRVPQPETKSDESSSGSSGSSGSESVERPSVGVRTDITIEISEESSANDTRTAAGRDDRKKDRNDQPGAAGGKKDRTGNGKNADDDGDDDNASIPVFKGMAGVSTKKPKPTPSRGLPPHGPRPGVTLSQRPTVTSFYGPGSDDRNRISGEYDGWNSHYPQHTVTAVWTTERPYLRRVDYDYNGQHRSPPYYKGYVPYNVGHSQHSQSAEHHHTGDWKPCYCSIYQPWAARAPTNPDLSSTGAGHPPPRNTVDNKVDVPTVLQSQHHPQQYRSIRS
uniref:Secreted protein n=1 Tax=Anopheles stephensi TaxID=30069 RepID=A0A182XZY8_ANOST